MASAALVVSRREESKTGLFDENGRGEVGFRRHPENPPISQVHILSRILARDSPRMITYLFIVGISLGRFRWP